LKPRETTAFSLMSVKATKKCKSDNEPQRKE